MIEGGDEISDGVQRSAVAEAAALLRDAVTRGGSVCVVTGAGVSAESGVPTFRGGSDSDADDDEAALWSRYDPMELASPEGFRADPATVTRWYAWRRRLVQRCEPNEGHAALAELERRVVDGGGRFTLATQNVDRLHQRAGSGAGGGDVLELHGTLMEWRSAARRSSDEPGAGDGAETFRGEELNALLAEGAAFPPVSPRDGSALRPCVVWFGESLPSGVFERAMRAASSCDVFLSVGTSAVVYPAAGLLGLAQQAKARTIEVNLGATPASDAVDVALVGKSGEVLPRLLAGLHAEET